MVFEQRDKVGGLWIHTPQETDEDGFTIPSTKPALRVDTPQWRRQRRAGSLSGSEASSPTNSGSSSPDSQHTKAPVFVTPIYDLLETNIPKQLMRFSDLSFSDDAQLFPKHQTVQQYIEQYARDILPVMKFETQVLDIRLEHHRGARADGDIKHMWHVETRDIRTNTCTTEEFDAVIVANGHYNTPYVPDIPGIREWRSAFPDSITHSKHYRRPEEYANKKVVVVGNGPSGIDIASQILPLCNQPILMSAKSAYGIAGAPPSAAKLDLPAISSFSPSDQSITFANGHIERHVDTIVFCTGYLYTLPFLNSLDPPPITDGCRVENTYQQLFYAPNPSLSLIGLPQQIIPFPVLEAQVAVVARVNSGRLTLPSYAKMQQWEKNLLENLPEGGTRSIFHKLGFPNDGYYINMLYDWAAKAPRREGLENSGLGKMPKRWSEWEFWWREMCKPLKQAFNGKGAEREVARTPEDLEFDFETWKKAQEQPKPTRKRKI